MAWLIGIFCVVVVIIFWRIFLPLGILALVGIVVLFMAIQDNEEKRAREKAQQAAELRQKIAQARENATSEGKEWRVSYQKDPASGVMIARQVHIESNDSLCTLTVEKRLNGAELTDLDCPGFNVSGRGDIEVKFSSAETSVKMDLKSYGNSKGVYIPSYQANYKGYYSYDHFIESLKNNKAVAIKIPSAGGVWMSFSLKGSSEALNQLGKQAANNE
jgi:type II secretory pathway pseudopilin PulG